jgi:glyoxylase-like metal-dependent hydrolase (beta-lactamase superfamily II)
MLKNDRNIPLFDRAVMLIALGLLLTASRSWSQLVPGELNVPWHEGAPNCSTNPEPPLQVHRYNVRTFILRESLCTTFEAPFMYLLLGSAKAVLIDTGDVADPKVVPLAGTVMGLLPGEGPAKLLLVVVHTHRHLDHRAGDGQFAGLSGVQVVGYDIESVRSYYHFTNWPNDVAQINLGDRTVDVIPSPGHSEKEVSFYDRDTGLFLSGDFLLPGHLLVDDAGAYLASAERVGAFVRDRPISFVLGGHIELDSAGKTFPGESQHHPREHVLQMTKDDLLAFASGDPQFNGFYTIKGDFILLNSIRVLAGCGKSS